MMRPQSARGFSLIEVMIVLVILGVVTAQMFLVFSTQRRVYLTNNRVLEAQESARLIVDLISHDTRMSAFMVPRYAGIASFDGGAGGPDRFCLSEPGYISTPLDGTPSVTMDNRADRFTGANVVTFGWPTITLTLSDMDIDGSGGPPPLNGSDFRLNEGIIIADGTRTWCTEILALGGLGAVTVKHTPVGLGPFTPGGTVAIPAIIYENDSPNLILTRNGQVLSTTVEDLQVEYWVDAQIPDETIGGNEFPVNNLNDTTLGWTPDPERIRRVQVSVVTRSTQGDSLEGRVMNRHRRPAVANRAAGPRDDRPRRRFTVSVLPRNLL
jgi:prepilin-type N-terminal cleavage/methylation domain-containing protein